MRNSLRLKSLLILMVTAFFFISCNLDDGADTIPIPDSTLVDLISADSNLSNLVAALERADLVTALQGSGPFTVLAPDNDAFSRFLGSAGFSSVNDVPVETLKRLLLNHVVAGRFDSAPHINLQRNYLETLADGPTSETKLALYFDADTDAITLNGISTVTAGDKPASNGIYHIVDAVIGLPTLDTFIGIDENFKSFDTSLDLIAPVSDLPTAVKEGDGPWTIFIPVEQAFQKLLDSNDDWEFLSDIDENLLSSVIAHHILDGNIQSTQITSGQTELTLEGDELTFSNVDGNLEITDGAGNEGAVIEVTDIQTANGVIHVIAINVLIPNITN